jgi:predicted ABC-type ATPase
MPSIIIIAGPNGSGKTTFGDEYLSVEERSFEFVNADELARGLESQVVLPDSEIQAARLMLRRVDELVGKRANFVIETTLASLSYAQKIPAWREKGYVISLVYLRLNSVQESVARVRKRVAAGGHGIPKETILRRFAKSLDYMENIYKPSLMSGTFGKAAKAHLFLSRRRID